MQPTTPSDIEIAEEMAEAARAAILPFFRQTNLETANKLADGFDPVTVADRAAEQAMRAVLARQRPDDGILGEEFGEHKGTSGRTWVLDPIDGTRGFISGTPTWGVLIALSDHDGPFMGVIDQPYIGERFVGSSSGAHLTGPQGTSRMQTRNIRTLDQATLLPPSPRLEPRRTAQGFRPCPSGCN